jgi:hypothetical protein
MHTPETCAALDCANDPNRSRFHTTTITREGMSTMAPYDGTLTIQDPNLVTDWDVDEQTHAYVIRDVDAPAPDWDGIGSTYRQAYDHARYDDEITAEGGPGVDIIRPPTRSRSCANGPRVRFTGSSWQTRTLGPRSPFGACMTRPRTSVTAMRSPRR